MTRRRTEDEERRQAEEGQKSSSSGFRRDGAEVEAEAVEGRRIDNKEPEDEVRAKRRQLYSAAGTRVISDLWMRSYPVSTIDLLANLGLRQRGPSGSCWSDSESSEKAAVGAVRQEPEALHLERLRCLKAAVKVTQEIQKSLGQATNEGEDVRGPRRENKTE